MLRDAGKMVMASIGAVFSVAACAGDPPKRVTEQTCEQILSTFSLVPTVAQTAEERRAMLLTIKKEQEADFAEGCSIYPRWQSRFNAAYQNAVNDAAIGSIITTHEQIDQTTTLVKDSEKED